MKTWWCRPTERSHENKWREKEKKLKGERDLYIPKALLQFLVPNSCLFYPQIHEISLILQTMFSVFLYMSLYSLDQVGFLSYNQNICKIPVP